MHVVAQKPPKPARRGTRKAAPAEEREVLNTEQAAAFLGIAPRTVRAMAAAGEIPGRRIGRAYRFSRTQLIEWLGQQQ